jgi:uncharacterized protein YjbI with pentapeptide repeats
MESLCDSIPMKLLAILNWSEFAAGERALTSADWGKSMLTDRATRMWARRFHRAAPFCALALGLALADGAAALDMMDQVDLSSPMFTTAEMTRADVEAALKTAGGQGADFSDKSLNGLDLSNLDLAGANFRAARMNKTNFANSNLTGAVLDQIFALGADFSGANLKSAHLFASQMRGAKFDGADLSGARVTADMMHASLRGAKLKGADLSADMKNQSMGLMRAILKSADAAGADFENANLGRDDLQYANLKGANFTGASLAGADASGADLRGAILDHADLAGLDVASAQIDKTQEEALAPAKNLSRAIGE